MNDNDTNGTNVNVYHSQGRRFEVRDDSGNLIAFLDDPVVLSRSDWEAIQRVLVKLGTKVIQKEIG